MQRTLSVLAILGLTVLGGCSWLRPKPPENPEMARMRKSLQELQEQGYGFGNPNADPEVQRARMRR